MGFFRILLSIFILVLNVSPIYKKNYFHGSRLKGKWYVIYGPEYFKLLLKEKTVTIDFPNGNKELVMEINIDEDGKSEKKKIKGKSHPTIVGRYDVEFVEKFWHKWITWDLRFLKIDFEKVIVLGSRNRFLWGLKEINFGWILSKTKHLDSEELIIS